MKMRRKCSCGAIRITSTKTRWTCKKCGQKNLIHKSKPIKPMEIEEIQEQPKIKFFPSPPVKPMKPFKGVQVDMGFGLVENPPKRLKGK